MKQKKTSYPLAILYSTLSTMLMVAGIGWLIYSYTAGLSTTLPTFLFVVTFIQWVILKKPLKDMYQKAIQENEYDEFGASKKKKFENLTRKEREQMDLQKAAQMESLLSSSVLQKIQKKGSENPEKDLDSLIGIQSVKNKTTEMVARMKFEQDTKKDAKKDKKRGTSQSANSMSGRHMVFYGSAGTGKAQPLYSKVLTPNGFVCMGDIQVGDKVISGTNNISTVLGVYPQGEKDVYEITFDDGSTCCCSDEHLWTVQTDKDRQTGAYRTVELKEILNSLVVKHGGVERKNYSIDYVKPIDFEEKEFYIHPYLLGILIGDGNLGHGFVSVSLYDEQLRKDIYNFFPDENYKLSLRSQYKPNVHDYIIKYEGNEIYHYSRCTNVKPLNHHLELLGLRGCGSHEKFIPKEYLYASEEQRRWLLKGLLDTDGYADKGYIEYSTTSEQLKEDVIELVHSLGGYASFKEKQGFYYKNGEKFRAKKYYRICIQFTTDNKDCFNLERKVASYIPKRHSKRVKRYIASVKYIGQEECQCIYIDDPSHLYITDNYIITHNTTIARIMTGFLYKYGYIKRNKCIEIDGNFLKAGEDSATKTRMIIQKAYGGVLFIDEAYTIIDGSGGYGKEAVATLIKEMEDNRDKLIVILAGYKNDMKRLLDANEGFKSRIKEYLNFPDYNTEEMKQIFTAMVHSAGFVVSGEALNNFEIRCEKERKLSSFGNGRTVRNILDETLDRHALNYGQNKLIRIEDVNGKEKIIYNAENKYVICGCDVNTCVNKNVL